MKQFITPFFFGLLVVSHAFLLAFASPDEYSNINPDNNVYSIVQKSFNVLQSGGSVKDAIEVLQNELIENDSFMSLSPEKREKTLSVAFSGMINSFQESGGISERAAKRFHKISGVPEKVVQRFKAPEFFLTKPFTNYLKLSNLMFDVFAQKGLSIIFGTTTTTTPGPPTTGPTGPAGAFSRSSGIQTATTLELTFLFGSLSAYQISFANSLASALGILPSLVSVVSVTDNFRRLEESSGARNAQLGTVTIIYDIQNDPTFTLALQAALLLENTTSAFYTTPAGTILLNNNISTVIQNIVFGTTTTSTVRRLSARKMWSEVEAM